MMKSLRKEWKNSKELLNTGKVTFIKQTNYNKIVLIFR